MSAKQTRREWLADFDPASPLAPLAAFMHAVESGASPEALESVRATYCRQCRGNAGANPSERDEACVASRCFMRHGAPWLYEYGWVCSIDGTSLVTGEPKSEDIATFHRHIGEAACVIYGLKVDRETGGLMADIYTPTLRGEIHAAIVRAITWRAGDRRYNVNGVTATGLRELAGRERDELAARDMADRQRQAATMRDEGMQDAEIAEALGRSNKAIRDWLGPKKTWQARREGWWAKHGANGR